MFKFKIIDWEKQVDSKMLSDGMYNKIRLLQEEKIDLGAQNTTFLIITDATEKDIFGGVSLIKKQRNQLHEDIQKLLPTEACHRNFVWECFNICCTWSLDLNFDFSRHFYRSLYEGLAEFGQQQEIGFVILKLAAETYPPTKDPGCWPYVVEIFPGEFPEDHFYGILPLRGCFYEEYQYHWEKLHKK